MTGKHNTHQHHFKWPWVTWRSF